MKKFYSKQYLYNVKAEVQKLEKMLQACGPEDTALASKIQTRLTRLKYKLLTSAAYPTGLAEGGEGQEALAKAAIEKLAETTAVGEMELQEMEKLLKQSQATQEGVSDE